MHSIQYLRGIAALLVVFHHLLLPSAVGLPFDGHVEVGASGVDIFFVISGFVIAYTHARSSYSPAYFLYRRVIRVVPLYWVLTAFGIAVHLGLGFFSSWVVSPATVVHSFLFLPYPNPTQPSTIFPLIEPGWTLIYEMFFYAVFTTAILVARGRAVLLAAAVMLTLVGVGLAVPPGPTAAATYTDPLLLEFTAGMLIARWLVVRDHAPASPHLAWLLVPALAGWGASAFWAEAPAYRAFVWGGPAILIVFSAIVLETTTRIPRIRWMHEIGDASYSIYLTHLFTLAVLTKAWGILGLSNTGWPLFLVYFAAGTLLSTVVGIGSYRLIERPLLHALRALWRPGRAAAGAE